MSARSPYTVPPPPSAAAAAPTAPAGAVPGGARAVPPRKRRRRAPASGAADDCFACRRRNVQCDRRRPYCTPCLGQGKECSGYKTQLTWGVGVASRGKLRGLSLPVAKKQAPTSVDVSRPRTSFSSNAESAESSQPPFESQDRSGPEAPMTPVAAVAASYDFVSIDPTCSSTLSDTPSPVLECQQLVSVEQMKAPRGSMDPSHHCSLLRQSLRLNTPVANLCEDIALPTSASSISGYSDSDYPSPTEIPQTPKELSYMSAPLPIYGSFQAEHQSLQMDYSNLTMFDRLRPTSFPEHYSYGSSMDSSMSSDAGSLDWITRNAMAAEPTACGPSSYDDEIAEDGVSNTNDVELGFGYRIIQQGSIEVPFSPFVVDMSPPRSDPPPSPPANKGDKRASILATTFDDVYNGTRQSSAAIFQSSFLDRG
ncbi:MAG: hypothetical protein M1837_000375 [Sclerophora amabilis]|nr:MAG: hypothetical protein M1837_000375 [Sclerophora amabilis]